MSSDLNSPNVNPPQNDPTKAKQPTALPLLVRQGLFAVSKLPANSQIPAWVFAAPFFSITKTSEELSIVCTESSIPEGLPQEKSFVLIQVVGPLDFGWVGILASLTDILAKKQISLFAISTYDTDYLLVKQKNLCNAIEALEEAGYRISFEPSST